MSEIARLQRMGYNVLVYGRDTVVVGDSKTNENRVFQSCKAARKFLHRRRMKKLMRQETP